LQYPYGCLEQKTSKVLPVVAAQSIVDDFKLGDLSLFKAEAQKVFDEISLYQTQSGGYRYWTDSYGDPDQYVTAYALDVMHLAKQKGYKIDQSSADKAVKWLETYVSSDKRWAYPYGAYENKTAKAYAAYVLSLYGKGGGALFSRLYADRASLGLMGRAYLLKAAKILKQNAALEELAKDFMNTAVVSPTTMHFELESKMPWLHADNVMATAVIVDAVLNAKGGFAGDEKAVRWLLNQVSPEGDWRTTSSNAAVFRALNSFYTIKENVEPDFQAELKINALSAWTGSFKGREMKSDSASVLFENLFNAKGDSAVAITKAGLGRLYYDMRMIYAPLKLDKPLNSGFKVERKVEPFYATKDKEFTAGQKLKVTLTVTTEQDRPFAVLEDFLPAGFEIVDTTLATESEADESVSSYDEDGEEDYEDYAGGYGYYAWGEFGRSEKYDDRIAVFADYLSKGRHIYSYVVQATLPGTYTAPAAWASQMYEPENFGRNATSTLVIK
jgi:uncharacterized protein YfaS (alpha-2-macroglobulin family)